MAGVMDRHRRFILEGRPVATGLVAVGDAWACTNLSAGRGLSVGAVHTQMLPQLDRAIAATRARGAVGLLPFARTTTSADDSPTAAPPRPWTEPWAGPSGRDAHRVAVRGNLTQPS